MARLLADENFPFPVTQALRRLGHEVVTLEELDKAGQGLRDEQVLSLAIESERAVMTLNRRHFIRLHAERPDHAGIVVCSFDIDFVGQAGRISEALGSHPSTGGVLIRVNRPG